MSLTVSQPVYEMLQSGSNAEIREAIGVESLHGSTLEASSVQGISLGKSSVPFNRNTYDGFPSPVTTSRGVTYLSVKSSADHASDGSIDICKSLNGGDTWGTIYRAKISGVAIVAGTVSLGSASDGSRLVITYTTGPAYAESKFAYCDDGKGEAWTACPDVLIVGYEMAVPFGDAVLMPSGKIRFPAYAWDDATKRSKVFFYESSDNGLTWAIGSTIMSSTGNGVGFGQGWLTETSAVIVDASTGLDATTKMVALVRNEEFPGNHYQLFSNDGGTTWSNISVTQGRYAFNAGTTGNSPFPDVVFCQGEWLYVIIGYRGALDNYTIRVYKQKALSVYNDTTQWDAAPYRTLYRSDATRKTATSNVHFGYAKGFSTSDGLAKVVFYDVSPQHRTAVDTSSERERIVVIPLEGQGIYEAHQTANQAIPDGTETLVTLATRWLDTDNFFVVSGSKIVIPLEGWYQFYAKAIFANSAGGTYRRLRLLKIDPGHEAGSLPELAPILISKRTISPSDADAEFNFIELSGAMWCEAGMEIRLYAQQDSGGALNLVNTDRENRATLRIKLVLS